MKKTILAALFCGMVLMMTSCKNESRVAVPVNNSPTYELVATQNIWTFIKLNTANGKMWLVQYTVEDSNNRFEAVLNNTPLAEGEAGRFKLYPTNNMWNFILLDQKSGKQWQVQWSQKAENIFVVPIEPITVPSPDESTPSNGEM